MAEQTGDELTVAESKEIDKVLSDAKKLKTAYKQFLAFNPPSSIIRHHNFGKFDYLPITAVERLLDGLFESWTVEILREGVAVNGFYVVVRLVAKIPMTDEYMKADGIGFAEFQTKKDAAPTDFTQLMPATGTMMVPKAKAEAIKNAAKSFGNIFGRNLTRNDDQSEAELGLVNTGRNKIKNSLEQTDES